MIKKLFESLKSKTKDSNQHFEESGMINKYQELEFGFFPLGHGVLSNDYKSGKSHFNKCRIMVLGNDFGTLEYLTDKCKDNRESTANPTMNNLLKRLKLETADTFFTNFYLGVREEGTNTKRFVPLTQEFKALCYEFFVTQVQTIDPDFVICLGHEVRNALADQSALFVDWKGKSKTLKKLYSDGRQVIDVDDDKLGKRKFIVIPHPCDTRNLTEYYVEKVLQVI